MKTKISFDFLRYIKFIAVCFTLNFNAFSQGSSVETNALQDFIRDADKFENAELLIDSISRTTSTGNVFSAFYSLAMKNIRMQINSYEPAGKAFVEKFMNSFAIIFLSAWQQDQQKTLVKESVWWNYFNHPDAHTWQMVVAGVNAHINGDMWKALAFNFSEKELKLYKKEFLRLQKALLEVLKNFYSSLIAENKFMRDMTKLTRGLTFVYAKHILYKWRSRQMKLAITYHNDPEKFRRHLLKIYEKKNRNDQLIYRSL